MVGMVYTADSTRCAQLPAKAPTCHSQLLEGTSGTPLISDHTEFQAHILETRHFTVSFHTEKTLSEKQQGMGIKIPATRKINLGELCACKVLQREARV